MQRKKEKYFTTGEFAAYFGIRKDTLFYYDRIGLFQPEGVGDNGYRYYSDAQITPFSALLSLREMGVPIRELKSYFGNPSPERLLALASDKIRKMDEEIRRLQETRRLFSEIAEHTGEARDAAIGQTEFLRMPERRFIYSEKLDLNMENATGEQWGTLTPDLPGRRGQWERYPSAASWPGKIWRPGNTRLWTVSLCPGTAAGRNAPGRPLRGSVLSGTLSGDGRGLPAAPPGDPAERDGSGRGFP